MRRPLYTYTQQEAFDAMLAHLRKQGQPAYRVGDTGTAFCAYRGSAGLKCAVGAIMSDREYDDSFERQAIGSFGRDLGLSEDQLDFFSEAQQLMHDGPFNAVGRPDAPFSFLYYVERGAKQLASNYNLTYEPPSAVSYVPPMEVL